MSPITRRLLPLFASLAILAAPAAHAQAKADAPPDVRASHLIGATIENEQGWEIGGVDDLLVDPVEGKLLFVVLTAGGRFEVGEEDLALAVPEERFRYDGRRVWWNESLRELKRMPWTRYVREELDEDKRKRVVAVSSLLGAPIVDANGETVGEVEDLVVSLADGALRFAVVDYDLGWLKAGKPVALPRLQVIARPGEPGALAVRVDRAALEAATAFENARWPGLSNSRMPRRLERLLSPG